MAKQPFLSAELSRERRRKSNFVNAKQKGCSLFSESLITKGREQVFFWSAGSQYNRIQSEKLVSFTECNAAEHSVPITSNTSEN